MASNKVTKKWEVFEGRNKFYCDGHLITSPHSGLFYLTFFLITIPSCLFFIFDCPYLAIRITPIIPAIGVVLFIFTLGCLLRTTYSDPGIIPRATEDEAIERQIEVPNSRNSPTFRPPPRTKEVLIRGQIVKLKYCSTCKIFRPPRASHCSLCDNCIDTFDHHCPWVGNCIGKRNYRFFYMFVISLAFLTVYVFSCAITHLALESQDSSHSNILDVLKKSPVSAIICFFCFLSIWSNLGMAGFHTYLIATFQTTNEDIKGSFSSKQGQTSPNPYAKKNVCLNFWDVLCGPMPPSLINSRNVIDNELKVEVTHKENVIVNENNKIEENSENKIVVNDDMNLAIVQSEPCVSKKCSQSKYAQNDSTHLTYENEKYTPRILFNSEVEENVSSCKLSNENENNHLYSNISPPNFMNHKLDLDPIVLTGSKENLVSSPRQQKDILHKASAVTFPNAASYPNITYTLSKDTAIINDQLNHNCIKSLPIKMNSDALNMNITMWADRLSQNKKENTDIIVLNDSRLKLPHKIHSDDFNMNHNPTWASKLAQNENDKIDNTIINETALGLPLDTTMIDTALDLDSLDGSTVSLWPGV